MSATPAVRHRRPLEPRQPLVLSPGIAIRDARYAPNLSIARHDHPWAFISIVLRGVVSEICEGGREQRGAGGVRFMPSGVPHANSYGRGGAHSLVIEIEEGARSGLTGSLGVV